MIRQLGGHRDLDLSASTITITDTREGMMHADNSNMVQTKRESSTPSNPFDRMEE